MATTVNADASTGGVVLTGDGSGVLELQAAGVTKVTINSSGMTLANPLPVASGGTGGTTLSGITVGTATNLAGGAVGQIPYQTGSGTTALLAAGTNGQYLRSSGAGAPAWTTLSVPGTGVSTYSNVTVATTYTLTSTSSNIIEIDTQSWNIKVVLPDATTLVANGNAFTIRNTGTYPILIEDFSGNSIGGVPVASQVQIGLNSIATSAGTWVLNQDACYSTEVSLVKTSLYSHLFTVRLSSTKFALVGTNSAGGFQIQGFTTSGDIVTAGTLTTVRATSATFIEAKAIDANRVVIVYHSGATIFAIIADLTSIASPTIGTETTLTTTFANSLSQILKFDVKPVNDIGYYESNLTYSARLTGTNTFALVYGSSTAGTIRLIGYLCGASGTTITVTNEVSNNSPFANNTWNLLGGCSISSTSLGWAMIYNFNSSGYYYGYTFSLSGSTWSGNVNNWFSNGFDTTGTLGMVASNSLIYVNTRSGNGGGRQGLYAVQFPTTGNAAPTVFQQGPTYLTDGIGLFLTANGPIVTYGTSAAIEAFTYTPNTSLVTSAYNTSQSAYVSSLASSGYIDTTTCSTFGLESGNTRVMANFSGSAITTKNLNQASGAAGRFYGYASSTNKYILLFQSITNTLYQKIARGTFSTSLNWDENKILGWNKYSGYQQGFTIRYCYQLGRYLIGFGSANLMVVPLSLTSTNGFLGNSGFKDYQVTQNQLTSTTNAGQDLDSQRVIWVQTISSTDSGTSNLPEASSGTNVRVSILRIANV